MEGGSDPTKGAAYWLRKGHMVIGKCKRCGKENPFIQGGHCAACACLEPGDPNPDDYTQE